MKDLIPSKDEAIKAGVLVGGLIAGTIASHSANAFVKQINNPVGHGVLLAGGFYGVCKVKHPLLQAMCAGAAVYGALRLGAKAVAVVTDPSTIATSGIGALIPDSVKESLRKFIPNISGIDDDMAGLGDMPYAGINEFGDLSLDDQGMQGTEDMGDVEQMAGPRGSLMLAA